MSAWLRRDDDVADHELLARARLSCPGIPKKVAAALIHLRQSATGNASSRPSLLTAATEPPAVLRHGEAGSTLAFSGSRKTVFSGAIAAR
jgi:hypothetical protein